MRFLGYDIITKTSVNIKQDGWYQSTSLIQSQQLLLDGCTSDFAVIHRIPAYILMDRLHIEISNMLAFRSKCHIVSSLQLQF